MSGQGMGSVSVTPDPITIEVVSNALLATAEEMGVALVRASYSSNIKERKDSSTAIFDARGRTIAQAEHQPLHLGSLLGLVEGILQRYPLDSIKPGDVFIANDPYSGGGTHLPDLTVASPVFAGDQLLAFVANIGHHGDRRATGRTVFDEGLRIPPIKLFQEGVLREDLLELILKNFLLPGQRLGDLRAQFAANQLGIRRLQALDARYGTATLVACFEASLQYGRRLIEAAIARVPDGVYTFEDVMDDDGRGTENIPIKVTITVRGTEMEFDFTGTAPQVEGAINLPFSALRASVYYAVKALLEPTLPSNAGYFDALKITAPLGCIVNPKEPAPVMDRSDTAQRVVEVIFGALANAVPDRVVAATHGTNTAVVFTGEYPETGEPYVYIETFGGGHGARAEKDGPDGVQVHMVNTSNLPVEALELEYPLRIRRYTLVDGSGGKGRRRGGLGLSRHVEILSERAFVTAHSDRHRVRPWGLFGGEPGAPGVFRVHGPDGVRQLPSKFVDHLVTKGEVVEITTAGGGGYGPVSEREPERVREDVLEGKL